MRSACGALLIALPIVMTLACGALLLACARWGEPFNISREDGLLEWSTVYFLLVSLVIVVAALMLERRSLGRSPRRFLLVLALLLLFGVGEELSWGQNIFGWRAPEALAPETGGLIQAGHGDLTLHNLSFRSRYLKFSIGGVLFSVVLLSGLFIHGVWLPRASRRGDPRASWVVERLGVFVPTVGLGALMFAAALLFHLLKPVEGTETREYKELVIAVIFTFMLVQAYFSDGGRPRIGATLFLLAAIGTWITGTLLLLPR